MANPYGSPLAAELEAEVLDRFLRYARIDTQSARLSDTYPSSLKQIDLSRLLVDELRALGLDDAELTEHGYVFATLPAAGAGDGPTVGLVSHVDTSPDAPGQDVDPQVWRDYDGGELVLPGDRSQVLSPATSALLAERAGHDIVTSDGTTLLGADDKAGVAEIMAAVAYLVAHPELPRAKARIGFTVDEEVGHGTDHFDLDRFGADFAYTVDGQVVGEIENETFSAVELVVTFTGVGVHPGTPRASLSTRSSSRRGSWRACRRIHCHPRRPRVVRGSFTRTRSRAAPRACTVTMILRDHDGARLEEHEALARRLAAEAVAGISGARVDFHRWDQYRNMREALDRVPHVVEAALEATRRVGLEPALEAIRGGTDGSRLTEMGLPTPNLFTGGNEFHSVREWISVQDMAISAATVVELLKLWADPR